MNIIIVGCGKVGYTIARYLSQEDHDIVIIDKKAEALEKVSETVDAMVIRGNGLSAKTLLEAGVKTADLCICVTGGDETNILGCTTAKRLGAQHSIARVRDPEYAYELTRFSKDLGLDMIINPEHQAALEISRLLRHPSADGLETFVDGRVEMVSIQITDQKELIGSPIYKVFSRIKIPVLIVAVERGNEAHIPHGDFVLKKDDIIRVLGRPSDVMDFFRELGIHTAKIKDVVIIGGGETAHYLSAILLKIQMKVKIIEIDKENCGKLSESFPKAVIIHGDGTDEALLNSENVVGAGAVVCLTDRDEDNVVIALYCKNSVQKVILKISHINENLVKNLGLFSIVSPKHIMAYEIIRYVRGLNASYGLSIRRMYKLVDSEHDVVEALEFEISKTKGLVGIPLKDLKINEDALVGCIVRRGNIIIPRGDSTINHMDTIIVIAKNKSVNAIDDILSL